MSVNIEVNITGDIEVESFLSLLTNTIKMQVLDPFINFYADDLRDEMIRREHVASGDMRRSTRSIPIQNGKAVIVDVPYAEEENRRMGSKISKSGTGRGTPHNFVEPSMEKISKMKDRELMARLDGILK